MGSATANDRAGPPGRLLRFAAGDGVELSGLLFEPAPRRATGRVLIFVHGTGGASVFDSARTNRLAAALTSRGLAFFPFNNRGSHLVRRLRKRTGRRSKSVLGGMAFERIRECVADIDGALSALRREGYRRFDLVGHSTGANKIAVYDWYRRRNRVGNYIFLAGGDDTGSLYAQFGARRFRSLLTRARRMVRQGRAEELVPAALQPLPMSWRSLYDTMNPDGDYNVFPFLEAMRGFGLSRRPLFRHLRRVRKPSLFVYGEEDEYLYGDVRGCTAVLAGVVGANAEIVVLEGADHGFSGREEELAELMTAWLLP